MIHGEANKSPFFRSWRAIRLSFVFCFIITGFRLRRPGEVCTRHCRDDRSDRSINKQLLEVLHQVHAAFERLHRPASL
jgi:hypothetical protein